MMMSSIGPCVKRVQVDTQGDVRIGQEAHLVYFSYKGSFVGRGRCCSCTLPPPLRERGAIK